MPTSNASRPSVSINDDWLADFDDQSHIPAPAAAEPTAPEPRARRRSKPAPAETSGDDWLKALDGSRSPQSAEPKRKPRTESRPPNHDDSDAALRDHEEDREPFEDDAAALAAGRQSLLARVAGLFRRPARWSLAGGAGLAVGLSVGFLLHPTPSPEKVLPPIVTPPAAAVDQSPRELVVGPTAAEGVLTSLADAIRKATPGQRIRVKPGTYVGAIEVDKAVDIVGDGKPSDVIIEADAIPVLLIKSDTASVRNLTVRVQSAQPNDTKSVGIEVKAGHPLLEDIEIVGVSRYGLLVNGQGASPVVRRVSVRGTHVFATVTADNSGGYFEDCKFLSGQALAVVVADGARSLFRGCEITPKTGIAVGVQNQGDATLVACHLHGDTDHGAIVNGGGRLRILDSEVNGFSQDGVTIREGGEATLEGCKIHSNGKAAVRVDRGGRVTIRRCNLAGNRAAEITAEPGSTIAGDVTGPPPSPNRPNDPTPRPQANDTPVQIPVIPTVPSPVSPPSGESNSNAPRPAVRPTERPEPPPDFDSYRNNTNPM